MSDLTTLRLGGPARSLTTVTTAVELAAALRAEPAAFVLGGGSNLVVADAGIDAAVVRIGLPGIDIDGDLVTVGAGVTWDDAVAELVAAGRGGLAPLSGIPGSAGATPIQNVGAYGTEVADHLHGVTLLDRGTGELRRVGAADLRLTYRSSRLKGRSDAEVVTAVTFRLPVGPAPVRYAELSRTLGVEPGGSAPGERVREAVLALRRSKGMVIDPTDPDTRSAGSFFTNPVLDAEQLAVTAAAIAAHCGPETGYPRYPAGDGRTKLSAAWLIERAGFTKGFDGPGGRVGLSGKHTLALVNRHGSTADLLELAAQVVNRVREVFAVTLHPEPLLIGVELPAGPAAP